MTIQFIKGIPVKDGYYLIKFNPNGSIHLVKVTTEPDGTRAFKDSPFERMRLTLDEAHAPITSEIFFSHEPLEIV